MTKKIYNACLAQAQRRRGFTLIELLVVVLIIGILAAVAVPQYNKTVKKTKMTEAVSNIRVLAESGKRYLLTTGDYPQSFDDLDVSPPGNKDSSVSYTSSSKINYRFHNVAGGHIEAEHSPRDTTTHIMYYFATNTLQCMGITQEGKDICANLTGSPAQACAEAGYTCYNFK
ncbi:MAG: prepilin-type N-terminal cleavage/methylation domain-containing protein [Elusimicrobium sp.]|jgi:prepilin-type N-terminal cleavage/methylation domain-containing protein|nr:prepilin-type N-terminal cleavage/methylation domain-containing protein [Elusimicrobium sp.]